MSDMVILQSNMRKKLAWKLLLFHGKVKKEQRAKELGADYYIDSEQLGIVAETQKLGGAKVIIATVPNAKVIDGLADHGELILAAVDE